MKSIRSRLVTVAVVCLAAVAAVATPAGAAEASPSPQSIIPGCAWGSDWGLVQNRDTIFANPAINIGAPDSSANYWTLVYTYEPGETITLNGTFPDARFQSFEVYSGEGSPFLNSTLTDYQIAPDPGSINPFQADPHRWSPSGRHHGGRAGERYTVTLSPDAQPGEANTLPLGPPGQQAGAIDAVSMRVYLQTGGVWAVPAPTVTFSYDGVTQQVPPCSRQQETFPGLFSSDASAASNALTEPVTSNDSGASGSPGEIVRPFFATASLGFGANGDTQYLEADVNPPSNGDVLVVKGKLPTTVHGSHPQPWPSPGADLRYWSLCDYDNSGQSTVINQLADGQLDYGCRNEDQTRVSRDGDYTFVLGTEAQRRAIERIPGVTFLPFSAADPTGTADLLIRNMLPSASFTQFVDSWPTNETLTPAQAAAADEQAMGRYYPELSWSTIPALERSARRGHTGR